MWHSFVKELGYPESGLFLCGSAVNGSATACSDVDFIHCTHYASYVYSESACCGNKRVQLTFFPRYKLTDYLICDLCTTDRIYFDMWSTCQSVNGGSQSFLLSIQQYLCAVQNLHLAPMDDFVYFQTHQIHALCEVLDCPENCNPLLIASELLLSVTRLMAGKQKDIKHISRSVAGNPVSKRFQDLYTAAVSTQRYDLFCSEVRDLILNFSTDDDISTTGLSYNQPPRRMLIVFVPGLERLDKGRDALWALESKLKEAGFRSYCFKIEVNQALDAGFYLCIDGENGLSGEAYASIIDFHKKRVGVFLRNEIKMLYPYRTAFSTGFFFGGSAIQKRLTPFFCEVSDLLSSIRATDDSDSFMHAASMCIYDAFAENIPYGRSLLATIRNSIIADVADPIGMYNIDQMKLLSSAIPEMGVDILDDIIMLPLRGSLTESIGQLLTYVSSLAEEEIMFPSISLGGTKKGTLLRQILLHLQDIMMLSFQERYETLGDFLLKKKVAR